MIHSGIAIVYLHKNRHMALCDLLKMGNALLLFAGCFIMNALNDSFSPVFWEKGRKEGILMKKRLLLLAIALVLLVGCVAVSSMAAPYTKYCQYCQKEVTWEPIVFAQATVPAGQTSVHKHYYVTKDETNAAQIIAKAGATICIDLNGKNVQFKGRGILCYEATADAPAGINIQDSVGGATVTSFSHKKDVGGYTANTNNGAGGVMWVDKYCTVNIYGGTYMLDNKTPQDSFTATGGIACIYPGGTLNVSNAVLNGGVAKDRGGCIDIQKNGQLTVHNSILKSGTSKEGACVNVRDSSCKVTLSGNSQVDEIYLHYNKASMLNVSGAFTGGANIRYNTANVTGLAAGTTVGTLVDNGRLQDADLFCTNGNGFSVAASGTSLKLAEVSTEDLRYECPHCKQTVKWEAFTTTVPKAAGVYHFYLTRDYGTDTAKQWTANAGMQVCIDLNGHKYNTVGRTFGLADAGTVLSIMDTKGGGTAGAIGGSNNPGGGSVTVASKTTFNLYSGTLTFTHDAASSKWGGTARGGVIQNSGTTNIYGGKIVGGKVVECTYEFTGIEGAGGAIYNGGTLNILGGELTSGEASSAGPCIYMAGTTSMLTVGGDAKIQEVCFSSLTPKQLTVTGTYTGSMDITYAPAVTLTERMVVGKLAANADTSKANISCGGYFVQAADPDLVLSSYSADKVAATGGVGYDSLQKAIDAAEEGALVELLKYVEGDITVRKNLHLQLNGNSIAGTVTVNEGKTLRCMDSATNDFDVKDGKYGRITKVVGNVTGAAAGQIAGDSYLKITEDSGVSFHCVRLQIYAMTLRVNATDDKQEPGLFYKSYFKADEKAAPQIETYGVALSLFGAPTLENLETECSYTQFTGFESGALGNLGNRSSTLLTGILKETYSEKMNHRNLQLPIYGRAYAKTADGQYLFGAAVERTLAQQMQDIDPIIPDLSETQVTALVKTYNKFKEIFSDIQLPGTVKAVQTQEEGTLKVLVLGNSHGLDATNLLYEVFHQEREAGNHNKDVLIAALYYSGCTVSQHHNYLMNNEKVYTYHKNDGSQPNRAWVVKDATCLDALQDEQWDVILMQQMNTNAARESYYKSADWKYVADYLLNNQDNTPVLGFHLTWANPDDYKLYLNDDAPYKISTGASGVTNWRNSHQNTFKDPNTGLYEQDIMYAEIMRLTQKYLVDSTDWLGKDYFDERYIMNSATPVHYAQNVLGRTHEHIYRDYTHMNDYGRLICAYQWYAQLMGLEELSEVNTDVIPKVLKHKNSKYPSATDGNGDYIVDAQMKSDLIASVNWALKNPFNLPTK